jgi:hypothetical protein
MSPDEPTSITESDDGPPSRGMDRRTMIKRTAMAGAVVAWSTPTISILQSRPAVAQTLKSCTDSISRDWTGNVIGGDSNNGNWVWAFVAIDDLGVPNLSAAQLAAAYAEGVSIRMINARIVLSLAGGPFTLNVPNGEIVVQTGATPATTWLGAAGWRTVVPSPYGGTSTFGQGVAWQVPVGVNASVGTDMTVTFVSNFFTSVKWKRYGAAYFHGTDESGVQPNARKDTPVNGYNAGAPVGWVNGPAPYDKNNLAGGIQGGTGSNFTGSGSSAGGCSLTTAFVS